MKEGWRHRWHLSRWGLDHWLLWWFYGMSCVWSVFCVFLHRFNGAEFFLAGLYIQWNSPTGIFASRWFSDTKQTEKLDDGGVSILSNWDWTRWIQSDRRAGEVKKSCTCCTSACSSWSLLTSERLSPVSGSKETYFKYSAKRVWALQQRDETHSWDIQLFTAEICSNACSKMWDGSKVLQRLSYCGKDWQWGSASAACC